MLYKHCDSTVLMVGKPQATALPTRRMDGLVVNAYDSTPTPPVKSTRTLDCTVWTA